MKKLLLPILFLLVTMTSFGQTTIQVNNGDNLQTLINNATNGTIFMVGGGSYGITTGIVINKPITLIGTGYFLTTGSQATPTSSALGEVTFNSGSSGSVLVGFMTGTISVLANNVQISRNYTNYIKVGYGPYSGSSVIVNNAVVKQNYSVGVVLSNSTNTILQNNIILRECTVTASVNLICSATIKHNTIACAPAVDSNLGIGSNIRFENNIIQPLYTDINTRQFVYFQYNVFTGVSWAVDNTNKLNQNGNIIYQGFPTNTGNLPEDARYILALNSPAKNSGSPTSANYDCGAFGGSEPYVLSGLPAVPTIYEMVVPTSVATGQTLDVIVKARIGN